MNNLNFGEAISIMKLGGKVARQGWNGKGMYIYLDYYPDIDTDPNIYGAFITMQTATRTIQPGWLASQADILAEDWMEVTDES